MKNNHHSAHKLAAIVAALAFSGAALAAAPGDAPRPERAGSHACHPHGMSHGHGGRHDYGHGFHKGQHGKTQHREMHERQVGLIVPGYGVVSRDFVDGMGLDEAQQKLVQEAKDAARALRKEVREAVKKLRDSDVERFASLDLEKAIKDADERRRAANEARRKLDEKWLAVWNSLKPEQQARVADHLKQRAEAAAKRAQKFEERRKNRQENRAERGQRDDAKKSDART